jgi:citrate synthase
MEQPLYAKGLEGVIAAETHICLIDGEKGKLYYRGYAIEDLAAHCTFEEVSYLLLYSKLPTSQELEVFSERMRKHRDLPGPVIDMIRAFPHSAHPMELLQSVISYLSGYVEHRIAHSATCNCRDTLHQVAQLASVVAAHARLHAGKDYVPARMDLSHGANFLYMLRGVEPDPFEGEIMDKSLILHAEHGFNASTFTARVVASTLSTCYCSISGAIGSLYGQLHGGANERVMEMTEEIGHPQRAEEWISGALGRKAKIMGMGHREYRVKDPRATIMEGYLVELSRRRHDYWHYELLKEVERVMQEKMAAGGKAVYPNVDFFSGAVYSLLGIPPILFTPVFAVGRAPGWLAHILEQRSDNRLFRPESLYVGPQPQPFIPMAQR